MRKICKGWRTFYVKNYKRSYISKNKLMQTLAKLQTDNRKLKTRIK